MTKKVKKRRLSLPAKLAAILLQLIAAALAACLLVFHGPFPTLRQYVVNTAMATYKHQFIAKMFLSNAEISKIMNQGTAVKNLTQDISGVNVLNRIGNSVQEYKISGSQYKGLLLIISNPLKVHVGYSSKLGKQGETTSAIAAAHHAVAAINGGGFHDVSAGGSLWTGTGAYPTDFLMSDGKIVYRDSGFSDSKKVNVVALDSQGRLIVGSHSIADLQKQHTTDAFSFPNGPVLVVNGQAAFSGDGGQGMNPRTAIGQRKDGAILFLVLDGRRLNMLGATLRDIQKIMLDYGAYNATNLDGGSSTTMYYNGSVVNNPCDMLGERTVATAIYAEQ